MGTNYSNEVDNFINNVMIPEMNNGSGGYSEFCKNMMDICQVLFDIELYRHHDILYSESLQDELEGAAILGLLDDFLKSSDENIFNCNLESLSSAPSIITCKVYNDIGLIVMSDEITRDHIFCSSIVQKEYIKGSKNKNTGNVMALFLKRNFLDAIRRLSNKDPHNAINIVFTIIKAFGEYYIKDKYGDVSIAATMITCTHSIPFMRSEYIEEYYNYPVYGKYIEYMIPSSTHDLNNTLYDADKRIIKDTRKKIKENTIEEDEDKEYLNGVFDGLIDILKFIKKNKSCKNYSEIKKKISRFNHTSSRSMKFITDTDKFLDQDIFISSTNIEEYEYILAISPLFKCNYKYDKFMDDENKSLIVISSDITNSSDIDIASICSFVIKEIIDELVTPEYVDKMFIPFLITVCNGILGIDLSIEQYKEILDEYDEDLLNGYFEYFNSHM